MNSQTDVGHPWWFQEYQPVGVELGTSEAVAAYDANQGTDSAVDDLLLDRLGVTAGTRLVDLGCGTGSFAVQAARRGAEVYGVDVGAAMLGHCRERSDREGVAVTWCHAGFLDYRHLGGPVDVVTTKSALHQLPDFWKQEALRNAASMLVPGGLFYLWDAVYSFDPVDADAELERWITEMGASNFSVEQFTQHVREEFSTYSWIIEGLLSRAGMRVQERTLVGATYAEYLCVREAR